MTERKRPTGRGGLNLPLSDEDFALAYGETDGQADSGAATVGPAISYWKLFLSIVLSAPLATFLALVVMDAYPGLAKKAGLGKNPAPVVKAPVKTGEPAGANHLDKLIASLEKSNSAVVSAIKKQVDATRKQTVALEQQANAIMKLADKKPQIIKVSQGKHVKGGRTAPVKVIVVKVPSREKFDLDYEEQKLLELAGIDLGDPITSRAPFKKINSRDVLKEIIRTFNSIIASARDHDEVSEFLKNNAMTGKQYAMDRLRQIR